MYNVHRSIVFHYELLELSRVEKLWTRASWRLCRMIIMNGYLGLNLCVFSDQELDIIKVIFVFFLRKDLDGKILPHMKFILSLGIWFYIMGFNLNS